MILIGLQGRYTVYFSTLVLRETERNLAKKQPQALPVFEIFRAALYFAVVDPPQPLVLRVTEVMKSKDAPIVAAATAAGAHFLATYDRKHLLSRKAEVEARFGLEVATPDEVLTALRREGAEPR